MVRHHIRNYSIFITQLEGKTYLFSYFEYTGTDYEQDMRSVAADPETQRWWRTTDPPESGCRAGAPASRSDMGGCFLCGGRGDLGSGFTRPQSLQPSQAHPRRIIIPFQRIRRRRDVQLHAILHIRFGDMEPDGGVVHPFLVGGGLIDRIHRQIEPYHAAVH
ncbi:MAG: L-rhamnose mutarotase [Haliea sp.]|nr:L-rhamnose mutarotase [Haliea sp.]